MSIAKSRGMRFITNLEQGGYSCFWVRVGLYTEHCKQKTFIYHEYGGKLKAKKAAQLYRDEQVLILDHKYSIKFDLRYNPKKESVSLCSQFKNSVEYVGWVASYYCPKEKKQYKKSYSINKWGFREAKRLAYKWRNEKRAKAKKH